MSAKDILLVLLVIALGVTGYFLYQYKAGAEKCAAGVQQLQAGLQECQAGVTQLQAGLNECKSQATQCQTALTELQATCAPYLSQ